MSQEDKKKQSLPEKSLISLKEEEILEYWEKNDTFHKTLEKKSPKGNFVFFEGPPTANGRPGIHHVLARSFKDIIPRYKTMQGYKVERKAGWDTHGLPVELQVEKQLGISGKPDIEKYGVQEFNQKCKESVWEYKDEWERLTKRMAYWLDLDHPYITYNNDYIESLWWVLSEVNKTGLLHKGRKVVPHCPRCGTTLSSHEVAQGYKKVKDKSVYVKFKVKDQDSTYILSWTTTPWTLPGNVALAVGEDVDYVKVDVSGEKLILAKVIYDSSVNHDHPLFFLQEGEGVIEKLKGKDLLGFEYEPLFSGCIDKGDKEAWKVVSGDFVTTQDGTGVVHTAVMYGEDDYSLGEKNDLPFIHTVGEDGKFLPCVEKFAGRFVKDPDVEKEIISDLDNRKLLIRELEYEHDYPYCWRCDSPLLYYAKDSWFIKVSAVKDELIKNNQQINWIPEHIKEGRFGEWLNNIRDWAISRQRYWGTPMPVWECQECKKFEVIGSMKELEEKIGKLPKNEKGDVDMHRPFIDDTQFKCSCGGSMKRVDDVLDCWFDSGAMPFAQHHYPFENKELIDNNTQFPADYISEAIDQTRGWFYVLLAVSTLLGKEAPYKNVICLGHIRDKHGKKMSKSKGNVVDPWMIADKYGMDSLRMHFYSINQPGEAKNFDEKAVQDVMRKTVMLLNNIVNYYDLYKKDETENRELKLNNVLDKWIVSKMNIAIKEVTKDLDAYHVFEASRKLFEILDEVSTWYLRRSRDRFKQEGEDKQQALSTLHYVVDVLIRIMAPFTPFVTESVYQKIGGNTKSVHLEDWPNYDESLIDEKLLKDMETARKIVELAHGLRDEIKQKVRQPLAELRIKGSGIEDNQAISDIIAEEVNVKKVSAITGDEQGEKWAQKEDVGFSISLDTELTQELKEEGVVRELVRNINGLRKKERLTINDRVNLKYRAENKDIAQIIENNKQELSDSTLSDSIEVYDGEGDWKKAKVNGEVVEFVIER